MNPLRFLRRATRKSNHQKENDMPTTTYVTETVTPAPVTQRVGKSDLSAREIALVLEGLEVIASQKFDPAKAREAAALLSLARTVTVQGITVTHV